MAKLFLNFIKLLFCCGMCLIISCSQKDTFILGNYESSTVKMDLGNIGEGLTCESYSIDSVRSLVFPEKIKFYEGYKFVVNKEKIYILDSDVGHTVYVFHKSGKYMYKLGERGRAGNEYIGKPVDFYVDKHENVHVFDRDGQKIIVFDKRGKCSFVLSTIDYFPHSVGLTYNNKYAYCFNNTNKIFKGENPALIIRGMDDEEPHKMIPLNYTYRFCPFEKTFFANGERLSHIPILSDSVLVFCRDSLQKVVHFDFDGQFITNEMLDNAINKENDMKKSDKIDTYNGVHTLKSYQETDSLVLLEYIYQSRNVYWLYNKTKNSIVHSYMLFDDFSPLSYFYLNENQIVSLVDDENVEFWKKYYYETQKGKEQMLKAPLQLRKLLDGEIRTPAIFYISLK